MENILYIILVSLFFYFIDLISRTNAYNKEQEIKRLRLEEQKEEERERLEEQKERERLRLEKKKKRLEDQKNVEEIRIKRQKEKLEAKKNIINNIEYKVIRVDKDDSIVNVKLLLNNKTKFLLNRVYFSFIFYDKIGNLIDGDKSVLINIQPNSENIESILILVHADNIASYDVKLTDIRVNDLDFYH